MPRVTPMAPLMREGRDAVVDAFRRKEPPPRCPYTPKCRSALFWTDGATRASALLEQLERIGA